MRAALKGLGFVCAALLAVGCQVQTNISRSPPESPVESGPVFTGAPAPASERVSTPAPVARTAPVAPDSVSGAGSLLPLPAIRSEAIVLAVSLTAAPCSSVGRHLSLPIPTAKDLDDSYRGAVRGIEIQRAIASANGTGGWKNATRRGDVLEVDVWARGSGIVVGALGSESCKGGEPADVRFEFLGHYRLAETR